MAMPIRGIFRNGKVELLEPASQGVSGAHVTVTFPTQTGPIDLLARGIDAKQAANLRARLSAFAEDWERPEMDVYDEP